MGRRTVSKTQKASYFLQCADTRQEVHIIGKSPETRYQATASTCSKILDVLPLLGSERRRGQPPK